MARTVIQSATAGFQSFNPLYWDSVLGENLYPSLYHYQLGTKRSLPRNFGLSIKIPRIRRQTGIVTSIAASLEGSPGTGAAICGQFVSGTLKQFGGFYQHSDLVIMTALSDVIELSLREVARDCALQMDTHIRDVLSGIGGAVTAANASFGGVASATRLKSSDLLRAAIKLDQANNPRPPDGHYPFITHPAVVFDLQSSLTGNAWLELNKGTSDKAAEQLYRGEIGRIFGARIITSTNVRRYTNGFTGLGLSIGASGYKSTMFAPDSFYVTEVSDMTAKTFVKQLGSGGTSDPLNQVATVGAKVFFTAIPANWGSEVRMIRVVSGGQLL